MSCTEPVCVSFVSSVPPRADTNVLGVAHFGAATGSPAFDAPVVELVPRPGATEPVIELWTGARPVHYAIEKGIRYGHNGDALFGTVTCDIQNETNFLADVEAIYNDVLDVTRRADYPHLLRMWNYFPGIHLEHDGLDRYQRFCIGRQRAFAAHGVPREQDYPAATVIGFAAGPVTLYFIAARSAGVPFENPRQVSAYHYPAQYGPVSPSFSRGMLKRWNGVAHFYVSGTASIVGHETRHEQQCDAQLHEVLRNLRVLVEQARENSGIGFDLGRNALLKVYVRHAHDLPAVRATLQATLPDSATIYLPGDICRRELLVEIEAMVWSTLGG